MDITVQDYYLIRKTIVEMLYDRSEQEIKRFQFERGSLDIYTMIPFEAVEEIYNLAISGDISNLNFEYKCGGGQRVVVCFLNDAKLLNENINKFKRAYRLTTSTDPEKIYKLPISDMDFLIVCICSKSKPTPNYFETQDNNIDIFWYKNLTYNVSKHVMVPKHEIIHPSKKQEIKQIYFLDRLEQLPTLLKEDPVAKYYGMRNGDICRITRENPNIGTSIFYRYVSDM